MPATMTTLSSPYDSLTGADTRARREMSGDSIQRVAAMTRHPSSPTLKEQAWMLVGVDGSEESTAALRWAANQGARFGGVVPATSWRYPEWALGRPDASAPIARPEADFVLHAQRRAASALRIAGTSPAAPHIVAEQSAGPMLVEQSKDAGLLVVGTRRRGRIATSLLGTVGGYCIARAAVPVVIVPPSRSSALHRRVIVGMDDSPEAHAALAWAVATTPKHHQVHVIHVTSSADETRRTLRQTVSDAQAAAGSDGPRVTGQIIYGPPASTLRVASAGADMLVVGRRGSSRIAHAFLGSVTTSLCRDPAVATVVVPAT